MSYEIVKKALPKYHSLYENSSSSVDLSEVCGNYGELTPSLSIPGYDPEIKFSSRLTSQQKWIKTLSSNFNSSNTSGEFILKGTFPTFLADPISYMFEPGSYLIQRDKNALTITSESDNNTTTYTKDYFRDNVIPSSFIFTIVGGGAGGDGSRGAINQTDGAGGGGGAVFVGIFEFNDNVNRYIVTVGSGGAGGARGSKGKDGGLSSIIANNLHSVIAFGGKASIGDSGGSGGSYSVVGDTFFTLGAKNGAKGGGPHLSGGSRETFRCNLFPGQLSYAQVEGNYLDMTKANGGISAYNKGGGGGASFDDGGDGGKDNGYKGNLGSGGGGAGGGTGGNGGNGLFMLLY